LLEDLRNETRDYIDSIDTALEESVGTYMCTQTCPCVELDFDKWESLMKVELASNTYLTGYTVQEGGFETFEDCYADKKTLWNSLPDVERINEDALALEK